MTWRIDKGVWLVAVYAGMLIMEFSAKLIEIPLFMPIAVGALAIFLYRKEMKEVDFNFVKEPSYWKAVYQALVFGLIVEAIGIAVVKYGLGIPSPEAAFAMPVAAPLVSVLISSPLEEVIFRGLIFTFLNRRIGFWGAAIVSSALFGIAHYDYAAWLGYLGLGIVWCRVYKATGNLLIPIGAHMLFNTLIFFARSL